MANITLGQVAGLLAFIVGLIGSIEYLVIRLNKLFDKKLQPVYKKIEELDVREQNSRRKQIRKEYVSYASSLHRGVKHTRDEFAAIFELEDEYDEICKILKIPNHVFEEERKYVHKCYEQLN